MAKYLTTIKDVCAPLKLGEYVFHSSEVIARLLQEERSPWILRRMKKDLRDFEGRKLFVKRHAYTEELWLNDHEWALYEAVIAYINKYRVLESWVFKAAAPTKLVSAVHLGTPSHRISDPKLIEVFE